MYRLETLFAYGWDKVNNETFPTREEAQADLDEMLAAHMEAHIKGDMEDYPSRLEWRVMEI